MRDLGDDQHRRKAVLRGRAKAACGLTHQSVYDIENGLRNADGKQTMQKYFKIGMFEFKRT